MIRHSVIILAALSLVWSAVAAHAQSGDLIVEKKTFELPSYTTVAGETIKSLKIGWEAAGTLNADKSNAILITHYFSGTSHAFGKYTAADQIAGYWGCPQNRNAPSQWLGMGAEDLRDIIGARGKGSRKSVHK